MLNKLILFYPSFFFSIILVIGLLFETFKSLSFPYLVKNGQRLNSVVLPHLELKPSATMIQNWIEACCGCVAPLEEHSR